MKKVCFAIIVLFLFSSWLIYQDCESIGLAPPKYKSNTRICPVNEGATSDSGLRGTIHITQDCHENINQLSDFECNYVVDNGKFRLPYHVSCK